FRVLSEKERVRLKLQAPLDTILSLAKTQFSLIESRRQLLAADRQRIDALTSQLSQASIDLGANFKQFTMRIDNLMMDLERRGIDFLDRYMRINHIMLMREARRLKEAFDRQVLRGWHGSLDFT